MENSFKGADGKTYRWVDADTFTDGEESYRIQGYNAPETGKIVPDEDAGLRFKQGQLGGRETAKVVKQIVDQGGFTTIEDLGYKDSFGRKRVRLKNELGDDLTNTLYQAGAIDVNLFTDEAGIQAARDGALREELRGKRVYDDIVSTELGDIQSKPIKFKETALNETEYRNAVIQTIADQQGLNLGNEEDYRTAYNMALEGNYDARSVPFEAIAFRSADRTREGVALNQFGTAWNQGWKGMSTGLAGFAELIGVSLGSETIEKWGADQVSLAKYDLDNAPELKNMDYRDIDSVWDAWGFMTNNIAMSAPYLVTLTAGTLAAPVTGGASAVIAYGSTGASYAGQVWNDIEGEKDRGDAAGALMAGTAMAVLDRLGLQGILKPSQLLTTAGRAEVARHLAKQKGISITAAKQKIRDASKQEIKHIISGMGNFASDNINNSSIMRNILAGAGRGALAEGITEAAQEGLGYTASGALSDGGLKRHFNPDEFINLLTASAIAGGTLGAGFSASGQVIEAGDRYAIAKGLERSNVDKLNQYDRLVADEGQQGSIEKLIDDNKKQNINIKPTRNTSLTDRFAIQGKESRGTLWEKLKDPTKYPELFRTAATTAFRPEVLRNSENARKIYALIGQPFGKLYSGVGVEGYEARVRSNLIETINPKRIFARFGMRDSVTNSQKISDMIRRYENGERDTEVMNNLASIETTIKELEEFANRDWAAKSSTYIKEGKDRTALNKVDKWWLKHQSWDWQKVRQNRNEWFDFMRKNTNYTQGELDVLYNKIANNEDATEFSLVEGVEFIPGSAKSATDQISSKPGYEKFANTNILQNMINEANQTAKYVAYTKYFGAGGKDLDMLLQGMLDDKIAPEDVAHVAYHVKNIIDAGTGNYKPLKNRKIAAFQRAAAFYSSIVGLPLSAISSMPEFAMILYQGRGGKDVQRGINAAAGEVRDMLKGIAEMKIHPSLLDTPRANIDRKGQERLTRAGLFADDATIATRLGLGETDVSKAWWQKQFFKYSGIAGITQLQRAIAASAVSGFVGDRIRILAAKPADAEYNQEQLDVYMQLANLGIDVDGMVELYNKYNDPRMGVNGETIFDTLMDDNPATDADFKYLDTQMNNATWHFVNDRVQNPQAFNRPLFFQDPHFQLFVQFNGFISTFTANIVPKLWNDYLKNGSPRMQYNTFAMMVTMMALAGGSQWLKDYIKFGGSTPYLNDAQLVQRALQSAGLLGTGERILQAALPLYKSRDEGIADRLFGETVGSSPTLRNLITAGKAVEALGTGDTERATRHATKLIPVVGVYTPGRNMISDAIHGKPFNPFPFKEGE